MSFIVWFESHMSIKAKLKPWARINFLLDFLSSSSTVSIQCSKMKFIFVCFSAIIAFKLVICSQTDKSLCKNKRNFCVKPASIRFDGSVSLAVKEFQRNAFEAYESLCRRANKRNADPAVRSSAENIVKKINDLCQVAFKVPSQIIENCCERPQNIWAAIEILKDLARRAKYFSSAVESVSLSRTDQFGSVKHFSY